MSDRSSPDPITAADEARRLAARLAEREGELRDLDASLSDLERELGVTADVDDGEVGALFATDPNATNVTPPVTSASPPGESMPPTPCEAESKMSARPMKVERDPALIELSAWCELASRRIDDLGRAVERVDRRVGALAEMRAHSPRRGEPWLSRAEWVLVVVAAVCIAAWRLF